MYHLFVRQVGMAANLKDYVLTNHEGQEVNTEKISTDLTSYQEFFCLYKIFSIKKFFLTEIIKIYYKVSLASVQVKGCEVLLHDGVPVAYASCPIETVSCHPTVNLFIK